MINNLNINVVAGSEKLLLDYKYKALFLHKFAEYFMQSIPQGEPVRIGFFGDTPVASELNRLVTTKNNQRIKVTRMHVGEVDALHGMHLVFLPKHQEIYFGHLKQKCDETTTLLVTETKELAESGAAISFYSEDNMLKFVINRKQARHARFKLDLALAGLASMI